MNTSGNQTYYQTEEKLRKALLFFMQKEQEPTVGQLCQHAGINRSTFYRHYQDVFDLMTKTENQLQQGLVCILSAGGDSREGNMEQMISYIGDHQAFYRIYLRKHIDSPFDAGLQAVLEERLKLRFQQAGLLDERRLRYCYGYIRAGASRVIKLWIDGGCSEPPKEISDILRSLIASDH